MVGSRGASPRMATAAFLLLIAVFALLPAADAGFLARLVDCTNGDGSSCYQDSPSGGYAVPPITAPATITMRVWVGGGLDGSCSPTTIDWGDGSPRDSKAGSPVDYRHTYGSAGTYFIVVRNACTGTAGASPTEADISPGRLSLRIGDMLPAIADVGTVLAAAAVALSLIPIRAPSRAGRAITPRGRLGAPIEGSTVGPRNPVYSPAEPPPSPSGVGSPIVGGGEVATGGGAFNGPPDYWTIPGAQPAPNSLADPRQLTCPAHGLPLKAVSHSYGPYAFLRWQCPAETGHLPWG